MTTDRVTTVMEAEDRASGTIQRVGQRLRQAFGTELVSTLKQLVSFSAVLGAAGVSLTLVTNLVRNWWNEVRTANRALALYSTNLTLMGFSTDRANAATERLRNNLSRTSIAALPQMDRSMQALLGTLSPSGLRRLDTLAEKLAEVSGVDRQRAFDALAEALAGNMEPLQELGVEANNLADAGERINQAYEEMLKLETPLEKLWRNVKKEWNSFVQDLTDGVNKILGGEGVEGLEKLGGRLPGIFGPVAVGAWLIEQFSSGIDDLMTWLRETEFQELFEAGKMWAIRMTVGFIAWFLGEDAANFARFALLGWWAAAWELLKDKVLEWGVGIGTQIRDGLIKFVLGDTFGQWVIDALNSPEGLMGKLKALWPQAEQWGRDLGVAIGNGLIGAVEGAINWMVQFVQRWINRVVDALNAIPGVSIGAPTIGGISIPRLQAPQSPSTSGPGSRMASVPDRELILKVSERELGRVVMSVVDGHIRVRNPGTMIT